MLTNAGSNWVVTLSALAVALVLTAFLINMMGKGRLREMGANYEIDSVPQLANI
jgi:hypothetical protein